MWRIAWWAVLVAVCVLALVIVVDVALLKWHALVGDAFLLLVGAGFLWLLRGLRRADQ